MSESEKRDILRKRNTQNARESRKKWKRCDNEIRELFESNEEKTRVLEKLVLEMTKELDGGDKWPLRMNSSSSNQAKKEIEFSSDCFFWFDLFQHNNMDLISFRYFSS